MKPKKPKIKSGFRYLRSQAEKDNTYLADLVNSYLQKIKRTEMTEEEREELRKRYAHKWTEYAYKQNMKRGKSNELNLKAFTGALEFSMKKLSEKPKSDE